MADILDLEVQQEDIAMDEDGEGKMHSVLLGSNMNSYFMRGLGKKRANACCIQFCWLGK